ncbi:Chlorophyllide a oxygenase, chloroplastic [Linum perenne]
MPQCKGKFLDANQALEVARFDIQYCDWRARQDLLTIMLLHEKVVEVLNPLAREYKSIGTMKKELAELLQDRSMAEIDQASPSATIATAPSAKVARGKPPRKNLNVSGPVQPYPSHLKNFWYPVAFSTDLKDDTMIPFDCFEKPWVIFRGKDGQPGCVQNTCAHRACPLDLGSVNEGRIQCPYHGWEYSTDGKCEKMPSTRLIDVKLKSLPCFEQEGMIWQIVMELPVEHGLLLDNLLDLAHAPFTHTSTFAKGWRENVWNLPVSYDKLGVRYRLWRDAVNRGEKQLPYSK